MRRYSRWTFIFGIAIALSFVAAAVTYGIVQTQDEDAATVNGAAISVASVNGLATIEARAQRANPAYHPDIVAIAREAVDYQEATRRGLGCSIKEARDELAYNVDGARQGGQVTGVLIAAENSGDAPAGYHLTPEAERTPGTEAIVSAYENDDGVIAVTQRLCAVGRMLATVVAQQPTPASLDAAKRRPDAVRTFRAELYASATVVGADGRAIDIRYSTPAPAP